MPQVNQQWFANGDARVKSLGAGGAYVNDGKTYVSADDSASNLPIYRDFLKANIPDGFEYRDIIMQRLDNVGTYNPSEAEQQAIYEQAKAESERTNPGLWKKIFEVPGKVAGEIGTQPFSFLMEAQVNVIIIIVAIALLAIAAYSIVVPESARGSIITTALKG